MAKKQLLNENHGIHFSYLPGYESVALMEDDIDPNTDKAVSATSFIVTVTNDEKIGIHPKCIEGSKSTLEKSSASAVLFEENRDIHLGHLPEFDGKVKEEIDEYTGVVNYEFTIPEWADPVSEKIYIRPECIYVPEREKSVSQQVLLSDNHSIYFKYLPVYTGVSAKVQRREHRERLQIKGKWVRIKPLMIRPELAMVYFIDKKPENANDQLFVTVVKLDTGVSAIRIEWDVIETRIIEWRTVEVCT